LARKVDIPSEEKAQLLFDTVEDRKAVDPLLLDLRGKTLLADFFLICSGMSQPHIKAIADKLEEVADERNIPSPKMSGEQAGEWILLDFGDVVTHVMSAETRDRYKLEEFWTTPQPKGALPPSPDAPLAEGDEDEMEDDLDELDEDDDDAAFFDEADAEVEPVDEDEDAFQEADEADEVASANRSSKPGLTRNP